MGCHVQPEQFFNLIFGYNDRYVESESDLNAGAGTVEKSLSAVPAGEIWVLQAAHGLNSKRAAGVVIRVTDGTDFADLTTGLTPASVSRVCWSGEVVMKEGDYVHFFFLGTIAGDDLYWNAWGYKMKV